MGRPRKAEPHLPVACTPYYPTGGIERPPRNLPSSWGSFPFGEVSNFLDWGSIPAIMRYDFNITTTAAVVGLNEFRPTQDVQSQACSIQQGAQKALWRWRNSGHSAQVGVPIERDFLVARRAIGLLPFSGGPSLRFYARSLADLSHLSKQINKAT